MQCKWGGLDEDGAVIKVQLQGSWFSPTGYVRTSYAEDEIDLVAVYCGELDRCYLLPSALVGGGDRSICGCRRRKTVSGHVLTLR